MREQINCQRRLEEEIGVGPKLFNLIGWSAGVKILMDGICMMM